MTGYAPQGFGSSASGGNTGMPSYQPNTPISWGTGADGQGQWQQNGQPIAGRLSPTGAALLQNNPDAFRQAMDYFSKLRGGSAIPQNAQGMNLTYPGQQPGQGGQPQQQPQWSQLVQALAGGNGQQAPQQGQPQPGSQGPITTPAQFTQNPFGGYGQGVNPMFNPGSAAPSSPPLPFATTNLGGYGQGGNPMLTPGGGPFIGGGL